MLKYLNNKNISKDINELKKYIKSTNYKYKDQVLNYLSELLNGKCKLFCDIDILKNIIDIAIYNQNKSSFMDCIRLSTQIYEENMPLEPTNNDLKNFYNFYNSLINLNVSDFSEGKQTINTINDIYYSFENKNLFFRLLKEIENNTDIPKEREIYLDCLDCYIEEARIYYHDEYAYLKTLSNLLYNYSDNFDENIYLNLEQIRLDKKLAGIYDVDDGKIKELESKIKYLEDMLSKTDKGVNTLNKKYEDLSNNGLPNFKDNIALFNEVFNNQETILTTKLQTINNKFKICTDDRSWLTNDVVNTFGLEYIANTNLNAQTFISYIVNNNLLEKWRELLKINPELNFDTSYLWFNNKTIDILGLDYLAHTTKDTQQAISKYSKRRLNLLKEIITINPNFQFYHYAWFDPCQNKIINYHTAKVLGNDYIANTNKNQMFSIMTFYAINKPSMLLKLKDILTLAPEFAIMFDSLEANCISKFRYVINNGSNEEIIKLLSDSKYCVMLVNYSNDFLKKLFFLSYNSRNEMLSNSYNNNKYCDDYKTLKKLVKREKKGKLYRQTFSKEKK